MTDEQLQDILHLARQDEKLGRFDSARDRLRQAAWVGDAPLTLDARLRLGKLLVFGGDPCYAEAEKTLLAARQSAEKLRAPNHLATAIHLLALLRRQQHRHDEAAQLLGESPATSPAGAPGPVSGQWFHYRGLLAADRNDLATAERLYFRAHQLYQETDSDQGLAEICDALANLMLKRGKSRRAQAFAQVSLDIKRTIGDRYGEAISLGTMGRAYLLQARYAEAHDTFTRDLAIATELNDQRGMGIMLNSLGEASLSSRDLEAAARYYEVNLEAGRGPYNTAHALFGLARVHLAANRVAEAASCTAKLAALLEQHPYLPNLDSLHTGLCGMVAARLGNLAEGEKLLRTAIESLRKASQDLDTIPFLYELRDLCQRQGQTREAVKVMATALDLLSECGAERGVVDVEDWLRTVDSPALIRLALERHFPDYLVEGILAGRLARQPPRKQRLTVLFSDVRGYTALAEAVAPEDVIELLNEWFAEATRTIRQHGGIVDKFIGDAVMALFGVPEPREDAAADAVRAALAMRDALAAMNLRHRALGEKELRVGVGIHTGEAVVGFIGSHLRQSYTAIGDAVNVAARLETTTRKYPGCDILISQETEQDQQHYHVAETEFLGYEELRGKKERTAVYQVRGRRLEA